MSQPNKPDNSLMTESELDEITKQIKESLPDNQQLLTGLNQQDVTKLANELDITKTQVTESLVNLEQQANQEFQRVSHRNDVPAFVNPLNVVERMLGPMEQEPVDIATAKTHQQGPRGPHIQHHNLDHVHKQRPVPWAEDPILKAEEQERRHRRQRGVEELDDLIDP